MEENKLIIQPRKYNGESTVTSVRLPKDMLTDIDKVAAGTGRTKNEIIILCMEYALENMRIK